MDIGGWWLRDTPDKAIKRRVLIIPFGYVPCKWFEGGSIITHAEQLSAVTFVAAWKREEVRRWWLDRGFVILAFSLGRYSSDTLESSFLSRQGKSDGSHGGRG